MESLRQQPLKSLPGRPADTLKATPQLASLARTRSLLMLQEPLPPPEAPPTKHGSILRNFFGPFALLGALLLKLAAKFKFVLLAVKPLLALLKTGSTMFLTIWVYSNLWGWKYAAGFVLLIFIHECGHLIAAKHSGLRVGAPVFIPFMGAFIALKDAPKNAWIEAKVGIGGPLLGSLGAFACHLAGIYYSQPLLIALAWSGYFLNLFNLTPVGQLDGGRIVTAISPWLWIPGLAVLGWQLWQNPASFLLWVILLLSIPRVVSLFKRRSPADQRFYEVTPSQRLTVAFLYFGLAALLAFGQMSTGSDSKALRALRSETSKPQR
jgi:Zn-dependent protease